jgi:hypothetical protein
VPFEAGGLDAEVFIISNLTGEMDLIAHHRTRKRRRRDYEDEVLETLQSKGFLDLALPVASALERDDVMPDGELLLQELIAQRRRELLAVPA